MAIVDLKSDLSQIRTKFDNNTTTGNVKDSTGKLSRDLVTAVLPRTNFLDKSGNVEINYDEKNTYRVKLSETFEESPIRRHWESGVDKNYYDRGQSSTDTLGIRNNLFGDQPFIIREIGERWNDSPHPSVGSTTDFFRGGLSTQVGRTEADIKRIGKFLTSTAGKNFIGKQYGFQLLNVGGDLGQRANIYSELSPQLNTRLIHFKRHIDIPGASDAIRRGLGYIQEKILPRGASVFSRLEAPKEKPVYKRPSTLSLLGLISSPKLDDIVGTKKVQNIDAPTGDKVNLIPYGPREVAKKDEKTEEELDFIPFKFKSKKTP